MGASTLPAAIVFKFNWHFVKDINQEPPTQALLEGIMQLTHRLGYQVVAKGVQTLTEQQTLEALG